MFTNKQLSTYASYALERACTIGFKIRKMACHSELERASLSGGLGWYVLDKNMKKYPNDFIPSVVIQFFVFTVVFGIWLFKGQNLSEIRHWFADLPHLLRTPNLLCPLLFASILGNLLTMMSANVACRYLHVSDAWHSRCHSTIIHLEDVCNLCPAISASFAKVSLIVTTEPLFAAVAAACCIGETFSLGDYIGLKLSRMSWWVRSFRSPKGVQGVQGVRTCTLCRGGFFIMAALLCNEPFVCIGFISLHKHVHLRSFGWMCYSNRLTCTACTSFPLAGKVQKVYWGSCF